MITSAVTVTSKDRRQATRDHRCNGDGKTDQVESVQILDNGQIVDTVTRKADDGHTIAKSVTTTTANGLSVTTQSDMDGASVFDLTKPT